jgi:probable phosphoglycerate mutase
MRSEGYTDMYFVRHGQTEMNKHGRLQSFSNGYHSVLTHKGRDQAHAMHASLNDTSFAHVYASPYLRALETAAIIAGEGIDIMPLTGLQERNFGDLETHPYNESNDIRHAFLIHQDESDFENDHQIETDAEIKKRMLPLLENIAVAHIGMNALFVTHSGIMRFVIHHFGGVSYEEMKDVNISETALLHIRMHYDGQEKKYEFVESRGIMQGGAEVAKLF